MHIKIEDKECRGLGIFLTDKKIQTDNNSRKRILNKLSPWYNKNMRIRLVLMKIIRQARFLKNHDKNSCNQ